MRPLLLLFVVGLPFLSLAQDSTYSSYVNESTAYYKEKDYKNAIASLNKAFAYLGGKGYPNDRYNAACLWALSGNNDSAFYHLNRLVKANYYQIYDVMLTDPDMNTLRGDKRWKEVCDTLIAIKNKRLTNPIAKQLDSVYFHDQDGRKRSHEVEAKYGRNSDEIKALWKEISYYDSVNLIIVKDILDKHGWLGADEIGYEGNSTLFLVIQHADLKTQQHYLPMMRDAVGRGKADASSLALLEDRVALREGRKQIYGSQIGRFQATGEYYLSPLEDPDNVDKRRASVGLPPLAQYLKNWNMVWDVAAYKKQLPVIEKEQAKIKW